MKRLLKILMVLSIVCIASGSVNAQVGLNVSISTVPPPLSVYEQPYCPGEGYMWVPGYWAYGDTGYYWVSGAWVLPPQYGLYWTPGYWGFSNGFYRWHGGYWGHHVGFYGGINYGFGYYGVGYSGGIWSGNIFRYNTAVNRINTTVVHNTYVDRTVVVNNKRSSFNGQGGVNARATRQEQQAFKERHDVFQNQQTRNDARARVQPFQNQREINKDRKNEQEGNHEAVRGYHEEVKVHREEAHRHRK